MINLFEYQNRAELNSSLEGLEEFLDTIWSNREKNSYYLEKKFSGVESQRFIQFLHKTNEIKSNKYVGVIHFNGNKINLLPKVFYDSNKEYSEIETSQIQNHILWWLSYCRKIKFPNYQTALGGLKSDFFEVLIYLFSKYTIKLLGNSIYQQYEDVNNELSFIKGRLNIGEYINNNVCKGRWHKLTCSYDAFVFDNKFNRIIKHVSTLLLNVTNNAENKKHLREILFMLDEVTEEPSTAEQCKSIKFNPIFGEFETVRDYCYLFLSSSVSFNYKNQLELFAFLLPMEYVFEDFIFGFINKELSSIRVKSQRSDTHLDEGEKFKLKPDIFFEKGSKSVVVDTKYKIIYADENDPQKGISEQDLYQMIIYAIRFNVDNIILFYPNTINLEHRKVEEFFIKDELANGKLISIKAYQLPVLDKRILNQTIDTVQELKTIFEELKLKLASIIDDILTCQLGN